MAYLFKMMILPSPMILKYDSFSTVFEFSN